jgi:hypothetical protein
MANRLLDRQASLLAHLTSGAAIFGGAAPRDRALDGIDPALLHLEAKFSYEKRIEKIAATLPRSFTILGAQADTVLRAFAEACPPTEMGRIDNARQLHAFVAAQWRDGPPYLADVMACELAHATAAQAGGEAALGAAPAALGAIRRRPGVVLVRCGYDVRQIFEQGGPDAPGRDVPKRDTPLAVTVPPGATEPQIFELPPALFDLLAALDHWTAPSVFGGHAGADALVRDLAAHALIEVRA